MNANNIEIEIKFPLLNKEEIIKFLDKNAEIINKNEYQKDIYFTPIHRDFLNVKYPFEWLRTRENKKWATINFKHFYPENTKKNDYCDEYETKVEDINIIKKIFEQLDIKERVIVEKTRDSWLYKDVEIVIDNVTDLWYFIELELKKHVVDYKEWVVYLHEVLKKLWAKLWEQDFNWYPYLILAQKWFKFAND